MIVTKYASCMLNELLQPFLDVFIYDYYSLNFCFYLVLPYPSISDRKYDRHQGVIWVIRSGDNIKEMSRHRDVLGIQLANEASVLWSPFTCVYACVYMYPIIIDRLCVII